jgi:ribonucleoside-diphosphate reductase alpha chain
VDQFCFTRFEPHGRVEGHDNIKVSTSVIDYVFRVLGYEYLNRTDLAHVVPEDGPMGGQLVRKDHAIDHKVGREHLSGSPSNGGDSRPAQVLKPRVTDSEDTGIHAMVQQNKRLLGDAPACDNCGHITIRNGTCYKCVNCGSSMGCS